MGWGIEKLTSGTNGHETKFFNAQYLLVSKISY